MPVPGFLASFADKAQSAINASPLASHLPSHGRPTSPDTSSQPTANQAAAQSGHKSHALESISHQIRTFGQQYSSTTPVQKIITAGKGVTLDFDGVARDSKLQSKELYTWGQNEAEDVKDVTDRLAYLNFVQGSLTSSVATKLETARVPFKALRDAEAAIAPRRNIRAGLNSQLTRLEHDQQKGQEKKIAELKDQIRKAELDDASQEREIEILKRKAVRESERLKWEALREYGEKLVLLSQAATPIIAVLPSVPPTPEQPYTGAQATGAARASLQRALDNYKTGHINLPPQLSASELSRSDTQSFGESHASELSSLNASQTPLQSSPSLSPPSAVHPATHPMMSPPPLDPAVLNNSPTPLPDAMPPPPTIDSSPKAPTITPTIAETGIPVSAGADGPGPASGSLYDLHPSPLSGSATHTNLGPQKHETAEEEKRRLAAAYSQAAPVPQSQPPQQVSASIPPYESAEEEKKRLEREDRERLLGAGTSNPPGRDEKGGDEDLPPYQGP